MGDEIQRFGRAHGLAEIEALPVIAAHPRQVGGLLFAFRAFRHHFHAEIMRQRDDGTDDERRVAIGGHLCDEGAVHLQRIEGETLQIGEARIACAEIVEG